MRPALTLAAALLLLPLPAAAQPDPCRDVDCGRHGSCVPERRAGHCFCDSGFSAVGNTCVELPERVDPLRARRDPSAGQRVVDFARSQLGRTRAQVASDGADGLRLGDFLAPGEWWCGDFVSWAYASAGVPLDGGDAGGWLVTNNRAIRIWYNRHGLFYRRGSPELETYEPQPGDYLQLDSPSGGGHAAIVTHVEGDTIHTIEGNVSGTVEPGAYSRFRRNGWIRGVGVFAPPDEPPTVEVRVEGAPYLGAGFAVEATVEDDGPSDRLTLSWSAEGPAPARFERPELAATVVRFVRAGDYRVTLTADDGRHQSRDTVVVHVRENQPPVVSARLLDQSVFAGDAVVTGEVTDDGVSGPATAAWSQASGPAPATIESPEELETRVAFHAPGTYRLRLEADDSDRSAHAEVTVVVRSPLAGCSAAPTSPASASWAASLIVLAWLRRRSTVP